ncbi:MAG: hypothetical protein ACRCYP_02800 [Alphaproteobacteria bacterium]
MMEEAEPIGLLIQEALQASHEVYYDFRESDFFNSFPALKKQEETLKHYIHTLSRIAAQEVEGEPITPGTTEKLLEMVQGFRLCVQDMLNLLQETQLSLTRKEEAFEAYGKISQWHD